MQPSIKLPSKIKSEQEDRSEPSHFIGDYETAPAFMKVNDKITHGYRINFNTPKVILRSLFMLHNETVNIWSHFLPAIFIIAFISTFYLMINVEEEEKIFKEYPQDLQPRINHYKHVLENLSLIADNQSMIHLEEYKQTVFNQNTKFTQQLNKSNIFQSPYQDQKQGLATSIKHFFKLQLQQFQIAKESFELTLAPFFIKNINDKLNSSWFNELKENAKMLKETIDSDSFRLIELYQSSPPIHEVSRWPIVLFLASAAICLLFSAIFHLLYPMSSKIYRLTNRFDLAGINLLISGSIFPTLYYGMYCHFEVAMIYLALTFFIASGCFITSLFEWIHRFGNEKYKGLMFGGFGISILIPLIHMIINELAFNNYGDPFEFSNSIPYYLLAGAAYIAGCYIYVGRCPERGNPGKYNVCGHSHQIWHGLVVLGIFFTYLGVLQSFQMRKNCMCPV